MEINFLLKIMRHPGIEPGSKVWETLMLTDTLVAHSIKYLKRGLLRKETSFRLFYYGQYKLISY